MCAAVQCSVRLQCTVNVRTCMSMMRCVLQVPQYSAVYGYSRVNVQTAASSYISQVTLQALRQHAQVNLHLMLNVSQFDVMTHWSVSVPQYNLSVPNPRSQPCDVQWRSQRGGQWGQLHCLLLLHNFTVHGTPTRNCNCN